MPTRRFRPVAPVPTSTWREAQGTTVITPTFWDPSQREFITRPTGANYVAIETLGVSLDGDGLRLAMRKPAAVGKYITLPAGTFAFNDFAEGDGGKFMHGLMVNSAVSASQAIGIVGSGPDTIITMVAGSSHFTPNTTANSTGSTAYQASGNQYLCSMVQFVGFDNVEFGNLTVQGVDMTHFMHGIRINGNNAYVHHVMFAGSGTGSFCVPPGETYSLMVSGTNPRIEDCEFDGRRTTTSAPVSSTQIGALGCTNTSIKRVYTHDRTSGFGVVQWQGSGLTTEDMWDARPSTGTGGYNGCHSNHEMGTGPIRHLRPHIDLNGYWGPVDGRPRRNNAKMPHFIFLQNTQAGGSANAYNDTIITDPVYDTWGGMTLSNTMTGLGGFAIMMDEVAINATVKPQVIVNGITRTGVIRPNWYIDAPTPFDPTHQYWIGANSGNGSVWG